MAEKTYNPFKMFGSWIGVIISVILILGSFGNTEIWRFARWLNPVFLIFRNCNEAGCGSVFILGMLLYPITFFLIGWGIHSLVRSMIWQQY